MANRRIEEQISALKRLGDEGVTPAAAAALRKALADRVGLVVAKAARIAGDLRMRDLLPDLLRAYDRLFENPVERDPQCWGKNAAAQTLADLDYRESPPFLRGAQHVQMEPVWGGQEDTAPQLRGICVLGLASCTDLRREEILRLLVDRLADPAHTVRADAARAVAQMGGDEAELLLRLKARVGDAEPPVIGQVFDCVLALEGERAVAFVGEFLGSGRDDVRGEAALALGSSRLPAAVALLQETWRTNPDPDLRLAVLRALSASRIEPALDFLLEIVRNGRARDKADAVDALQLHKESEEIRRRLEEALAARGTA